MRILEEFWYGNIEPTEYDTSSCKEYKKLLELICRNEEKLKATMTDEQKELFEKYSDCVREHQTNTDCLIFQNGFKLGARMMLEVMEEYPERKPCPHRCNRWGLFSIARQVHLIISNGNLTISGEYLEKEKKLSYNKF